MPEDTLAAPEANAADYAPSPKRWAAYLVKSVVLVGLLCLFSRQAGSLPPLAIALVWAALSALSAVGVTYHVVVRKTLKRHEYVEKGLLSRLNNGRVASLIVSFAASAWCMAGLILEMPKWGLPEWCILFAAMLLYLVVSLLV